MLRKLVVLTFISMCLSACGQNKNQPTADKPYDINQFIFPEAKDITADNYVEKLFKNIKHYDEEPIYYYRINKQNCLIEVQVNDVTDHFDYELSNYITPIKAGEILKSGPQKITVRMYPVGNLLNESWGKTEAEPITRLSDKSSVHIEVVRIDEKSDKSFDDEKSIKTVVSPKEAAGKEYYEFSFTFDAEVPYKFEGWTKGQDLTKLDPELVERKAVEFYKMVAEIHLNKDVNAWLKLNYPADIRIKEAFYRDKKNLQETLEEYKEDILDDYYKDHELTDYTPRYEGDGKLFRLINNRKEASLRGGGALILENDDRYNVPGIILYLPKGRDLEKEGFMMWK